MPPRGLPKPDSLLDRGVDVNVKKIRDLTVADQDILAAVVNSSCDSPYNDFSDINLKVRVMTSPVFSLAAIGFPGIRIL